jgi:hypothetical protein
LRRRAEAERREAERTRQQQDREREKELEMIRKQYLVGVAVGCSQWGGGWRVVSVCLKEEVARCQTQGGGAYRMVGGMYEFQQYRERLSVVRLGPPGSSRTGRGRRGWK